MATDRHCLYILSTTCQHLTTQWLDYLFQAPFHTRTVHRLLTSEFPFRLDSYGTAVMTEMSCATKIGGLLLIQGTRSTQENN